MEYTYYAFISYNAQDTAWGMRLQRKLEHYRMPATLCSERGWKRTPLKPIFFAPTDIQPGGLSEELQERLRASKHLIVICSPHSAQSEWVGREIAYFHSLGRAKNIHFFIVDGQPHSGDPATECFNPIVKELGLPEILGANIHEKIYRWPWLNRERAYVQLISKLLEVEFDAIWQRHRRLLVRKMVAWAVGVMVILVALVVAWRANKPVDVEFQLHEAHAENPYLPRPDEIIARITLENEEKIDTIPSLQHPLVFANVPRKFLNSSVRLQIACRDYVAMDSMIRLMPRQEVAIRRDETIYGRVQFLLWNPNTEKPMPHVTMQVDGVEVTSDDQGRVVLSIPLEKQKSQYPISAAIPLQRDTIYMPCGEHDVLLVQ